MGRDTDRKVMSRRRGNRKKEEKTVTRWEGDGGTQGEIHAREVEDACGDSARNLYNAGFEGLVKLAETARERRTIVRRLCTRRRQRRIGAVALFLECGC
jgi:hypothetical protein